MASVDVKNAHGAVEWMAIQSEIEALHKKHMEMVRCPLQSGGTSSRASLTTVISSPTQ